jgi:N-acetylneuraminic acid mutarotase
LVSKRAVESMSDVQRYVNLFGGKFAILVSLSFLLPLGAQDRPDSKLAPMPVGRNMFVATPIQGCIYCVGGTRNGELISQVHAYDVARNMWTEKAKWPTPSAYPCGAAVNGKLYIVGGPTGKEHRTSVVERYDPATDTWERLADLPVARSHSVAVSKGDSLYVIGGHGRGDSETGQPGKDLDDVWVLDTQTGRWSKGPRLPRAIHGSAAAVVNGLVHLFGGLTDQGQHLCLDGDRWVKRADVPFGVVKMPATSVKGKAVVIGGGENCCAVAIYDPAADKWTTGDNSPVPRFLSQVVTVGDTVYALGGIQERGGSQKQVQSFDLETRRWRE